MLLNNEQFYFTYNNYDVAIQYISIEKKIITQPFTEHQVHWSVVDKTFLEKKIVFCINKKE